MISRCLLVALSRALRPSWPFVSSFGVRCGPLGPSQPAVGVRMRGVSPSSNEPGQCRRSTRLDCAGPFAPFGVWFDCTGPFAHSPGRQTDFFRNNFFLRGDFYGGSCGNRIFDWPYEGAPGWVRWSDRAIRRTPASGASSAATCAFPCLRVGKPLFCFSAKRGGWRAEREFRHFWLISPTPGK